MSWATYLTTTIEFNRKTYKTRGEVEEDIEDCEDNINAIKQGLTALALITEPKKFMEDDDTSPMWWVQNEVKEHLDDLEENLITKYKLELLLEHWKECHYDDDTPIKRELSINYVDGDEKRSYCGSVEGCKEKFKKLDNSLPVPLIDGDFIFDNNG